MLFGIFAFFTLLQVLLWAVLFGRLARWSPRPAYAAQPPVSLIVCARNERSNLEQHLPLWLEQDYPDFELLLVDDGSTDGTASFLAQYSHPRLRVLTISDKPAALQGKKYALSKGIEAARHDWLLLTDADCRPASANWMAEMQAARRSPATNLVLGYGPYEAAPDKLLSLMVDYETSYAATQYLSLALWGLPYMGVGRNLMYHRLLYTQAQGFTHHEGIASGDDDLLISAAAEGKRTEICLSPSAFCYSKPPQSWGDWYRQKQRHLSTSGRYKTWQKFLLGSIALSHFGFYGVFFVGICFNFAELQWWACFLLRTIVYIIVYRTLLTQLREDTLKPWIWAIDMAFLCYYVLMAPYLLIRAKTQWK